MPIFDFIGKLVSPITGLIDSLHTSEEEKLRVKAQLLALQTEFAAKALDYESKLVEAQASAVTTEAKSESALTRSWRPLTMLIFVALVVWYYAGSTFGWPVPAEAFVDELFALIKIGLGGYVLGRSAEKVVPAVTAALKARER